MPIKLSELRTWKIGAWVLFILGGWLLFVSAVVVVVSLFLGGLPGNAPIRTLIGALVGGLILLIGADVLRHRAKSTLPYGLGAVFAAALGVAIDVYHTKSFSPGGDFGPYVLVIVTAAVLLFVGNQVYKAERDPLGNDAFQRFMRRILPSQSTE